MSGKRSTWATVLSWSLVIAWAAFIFFMSAHSGNDLNEGTDLVARVKQWLSDVQLQLFGPGVDLVSSAAHFCEYTVFGALLANAVGGPLQVRSASVQKSAFLIAFIVAVAIASAYAITDEVHQIFVPDRTCDPIDWLVDTLGAALGAGLWTAVGWKRSAQR